MAIKIGYNYKGIEANYWKKIASSENVLENKTIVSLALYLNEEARKADVKNYLISVDVEIKGTGYNTAQQYTEIMKLDAWVNGISI